MVFLLCQEIIYILMKLFVVSNIPFLEKSGA